MEGPSQQRQAGSQLIPVLRSAPSPENGDECLSRGCARLKMNRARPGNWDPAGPQEMGHGPCYRQVGMTALPWGQNRGRWQSWDRRGQGLPQAQALLPGQEEAGGLSLPCSSPSPSERRGCGPGHQGHDSWSWESQLHQFYEARPARPWGSGRRGHSPGHPGGLAEPGEFVSATLTTVQRLPLSPPSPRTPILYVQQQPLPASRATAV